MNSSPRPPDLMTYLPLARWGRRELGLYGVPLLVATFGLALLGPPWCWFALLPGALLALLLWFFRDLPRRPPNDPAAFLSPADGKIVEIADAGYYNFLDGPAVRIGIFLSIFDCHINRAPRAARVVETHYEEGAFKNALHPDSAATNEFMWLGFEEASGLKHAVRQIAGMLARRIVCELWPGDEVRPGQAFGMIKLGSRAELIVPAEVEIICRVGDRVKAGVTILAREKTDG